MTKIYKLNKTMMKELKSTKSDKSDMSFLPYNQGNQDNQEFENLACSGGGVKGMSYVGAFKALNDLGKMKYIKRIAGTSSGGLFGIFVACKCTNQEIDYYADKFYDSLSNYPEGMIQQGINLSTKMGLHDNSNIYYVVNSILSEKFGIDNMTFKQLYDKTQIEFTTVTTCVSTREEVHMNYISYPDLSVAKAVQMTTAIPIFFVQVKWDNMIWIDGGSTNNCPINLFDKEIDASGSVVLNKKTLGIYLQYEKERKKIYEINSIKDLLEGIESSQIDNNMEKSILKYDKRSIIDIDTGDIGTLDLDLTEKQKKMLIDNGYNAISNFFKQREEKKNKQTYWEFIVSSIWNK